MSIVRIGGSGRLDMRGKEKATVKNNAGSSEEQQSGASLVLEGPSLPGPLRCKQVRLNMQAARISSIETIASRQS